MIYLIGSLRNPEVPRISKQLRDAGIETFDDWYAAGPEADDKWKEYEVNRGRTYVEALDGFAAEHVFSFDLFHLNRSEAVILVLPAGRSGHLELGYALGRGKAGYILLTEDNDRFDVMYKFATRVTTDLGEVIDAIRNPA